MSLESAFHTAQENIFQARVHSALMSAAIAVSGEADTVAYYAERQALTQKILRDASQVLPLYTLAVSVHIDAAAAVYEDDSVISNTVSALYTAFARAYYGDNGGI